MKIKKGDTVMIIAGKDKGKTGKIEKTLSKMEKVIIQGLNLSKSSQRAKRKDQKGQIVEKSMPIHISNVSILDPKTGKPTKIGTKIVDGKKKRVAKKSQTLL